MRIRSWIIAIAILLTSVASRAGAQDPNAGQPAPFTNVFLALGNAFSNVNALNVRFDSAKYDAIAGHGFSIGAGGYIPYGRALFGGEYHDADFGFESTGQGRTNKMHSHYWMVTAGYAVYTTWRLNVVGLLGMGLGTTKITVSDRLGGPTASTTTDPLFDDVLANPGFSSVLTGSYSIFQPAIGVDYLILKSDDSHNGFTVGIRMGTSISPHRTSWTYEGRNVVGAPDAGPVGSFVRLNFGYGGFKLIK